MYKTNNVKEEKNVNNVGAILIARKPQRNTKTNVGADVFVNSTTKKCNIGVGANASVCPNATKTNQKNVGVGLDQPGSVKTDPYKIHAITLVALVITVIILIILAGVSLNLALGQNGIFVKSKEAVDKYKDSAQQEQNEMDNLYNTLVGLTGGGAGGVDYSQLKIGDYVNYPVKYDNVATWINGSDGKDKGYYPEDKYANKWRIISIDEENNEVKLVSAGVPLNYYHYNNSSTSVENLTTNFFNTNIKCGKGIQETPEKNKFYQSGFKDGESGSYVADISKVEGMFKNNLTKTGTNGKPDVQSMTKDDLDAVYKEITKEEQETSSRTYVNGTEFKELLAIPCKENKSDKYATTWLDSAFNDLDLWVVHYYGYVSDGTFNAYGVRPIVSLESNVKFTPASSNENETTTWNISK